MHHILYLFINKKRTIGPLLFHISICINIDTNMWYVVDSINKVTKMGPHCSFHGRLMRNLYDFMHSSTSTISIIYHYWLKLNYPPKNYKIHRSFPIWGLIWYWPRSNQCYVPIVWISGWWVGPQLRATISNGVCFNWNQ